RVGARPVAVQSPWGRQDAFEGSIDLVEMKAVRYLVDTLGSKMEVLEIPEDHRARALEARDKLLEAVCEADDALLAKYLAGAKVQPDELRAGIRRGTIK